MLKKLLIPFGVAVIASIGFLSFLKLQYNPEPILGSVVQGNEYQATSTLNGTGAGQYTISSVPGVLGSIIIVSSSNAGGFTVYDADGVTSTPSTTIAVFPANATVGTYTFDKNIFQGVRIEVPANFNGQFVTTYRP